MINYEKLKLAHELAEKLGRQIHYAYQNEELNHVAWVSLEDLFFEMEKAIKKYFKLKIGERVFTINYPGKEIIESEIIYIMDNEFYLLKFEDGFTSSYKEHYIYKSKNELIESQLQYWSKQYEELNTIDCGDKKD